MLHVKVFTELTDLAKWVEDDRVGVVPLAAYTKRSEVKHMGGLRAEQPVPRNVPVIFETHLLGMVGRTLHLLSGQILWGRPRGGRIFVYECVILRMHDRETQVAFEVLDTLERNGSDGELAAPGLCFRRVDDSD